MLLNPFIGVNSVGSAGVTYFFEERFEGTGYQNSWTESGTGTIDEDYTTSPLEASQSLRIAATAQQPITVATFASDQSELWGFFRFRINVANANNRNIFVLRDSGATAVFAINLNTDNGFQVGAAALGTVTVDKMVTSSDYNVWWHYKAGSGANAQASVGFSTGTTEITGGNSYRSLTNGTATGSAHDLRLGFTSSNSTFEIVFDQILISTTGTIGDNPA